MAVPATRELTALALVTTAALVAHVWHRELLRDLAREHDARTLGENQHPEDLATPGRW